MYKFEIQVVDLPLEKFGCHYNWDFDKQKFKERLEKNIHTCEAHARQTPDPTVLNFLGFLYVQQNRFVKAEETFKQVLELVPDEPVALANLAYFYKQQQRENDAQTYLKKLNALTKGTFEAWQYWAKAYLHVRLFEYPKAIDLYNEAIKVITSLPFSYRYKIYLYKGIELNRIAKEHHSLKDNFQSAIDALEEALKLNTNDYLIYCHLGVAYGNLTASKGKNFKIACVHFQTALKLKPHDATTMKFFGKLLAKKRNYNVALNYFNQAIEHSKTDAAASSAYHNRAMLYRKFKKIPEAKMDLEQAAKLDPTNVPAIMDLLHLYDVNEENKKALTWCQQIIQKQSNPSAELRYLLATLLLKTNNHEHAIKELEALFISDIESDFYQDIKEHLIVCYLRNWDNKGDVNELIKCLNIYLKFNELEPVLKLIKKGLSKYPKHYLLNYYQGSLLIRQGKYLEGTTYILSAFEAANTEIEKNKCFRKVQTAYFAVVSKLQQARINSSPLNIINNELDNFINQKTALGNAYHELEARLHKYDKPRWHQNFQLFYSSKKPHKKIYIEGDRIHKDLKNEFKEKYSLLFTTFKQKIPESLNLATIRLSFVVSDRTHEKSGSHGRKVVAIPLLVKETENSISHVTNYYPFYQMSVHNNQHVPRSHELLQDVLASKPLAKHASIIQKFNSPNPSQGFHREFHCSERALYAFLNQPEIIKEIIDSVELQCSHQPGLKFYMMVLDIHTDRYPCNQCTESMFFWYAPNSEFLNNLIKEINARGHKVQTKADTLEVIVRVSGDSPAEGQKKQSASDHETAPVDIKSNTVLRNSTILLQRDDTELESLQNTNPAFINMKKFTIN